MQSMRIAPPLCLLVLLGGLADSARADGKFFRRPEVVDEPGIQAQRGVIAFKDGIETLIVQSDLSGEDTSYGWLLPLPAEPTSITPCQVNSLNILNSLMRPKAEAFPEEFLIFSAVLTLVIIAICLEHMRSKTLGNASSLPVKLMLGLLLVVISSCLLLPSLSSAGVDLPGGVEVLQTTKAGVYDVTIIKGETAEAVEAWLESKGFAAPASATTVIEEYVADNWCFLAAKIATDAKGPDTKGTVSHHPLKVSFPASQAVYPLKLTGSDGAAIQLDLYVIAERRAVADNIKTWLCDAYYKSNHFPRNTFDRYAYEVPPTYVSHNQLSNFIAVPVVSELMWPGCVMTHLHGRLDARDMRRDLSFTWRAPTPKRITLFSQSSALGWSAVIAILVLAVSFAWLTARATRKGWTWQMLLRRRFLVAVAIGLLAGGVRYATSEIVPVNKSTRNSILNSKIAESLHAHALEELSKNPPESPFPEAYRKLLMEDWPYENLDDAADLVKPGDFVIVATESGWRLTIIDRFHLPVTIPISSDGVPILASK